MQAVKNLNNPAKICKSLSQRAVKSSLWVFLLRAVQQLFSLARLVILARLLAPEDFGLMGIAFLVMATLDTFSQTGFQQALIQKKCDIESYLDSAWTFLILRSFIIFIILYLIAPYAATFFVAPEAKPIIEVIGLSVIFQAFTNIGIIYFQKELEFNKQFVYQISGTLTDFLVAIVAVYIIGNVWALVFGMLAGNAAMLITSYLVHPYRPHLNFNIKKLRELSNYGKWVLGSTILVFLVTQGDDVLVGKLLGTTYLGFYQLAYKISNLPATEITHLISQVTFPLYSKIQDDIQKVKYIYLNVLKYTILISFIITVLIFTLSNDFILIFLGEKWMPMVPAIKLLVVSGLIRSVQATSGPIFYALDKIVVDTKIQVIRFLVLAISIYPFIIKWGINGASLAVLISILLACLLSIIILAKSINLFSRDIAYLIICPSVCGFAAMNIIFYLKSIINIGVIELLGISIIGVIVYIFTLIIIERIFNYKLLPSVKEIILTFKYK